MPDINPVWREELWIGTEYSNSSWTYKKLCAGIQGAPWSSNEQIQQYFFMCGNGFAHNEVTGIAPEIQVTGRRVVGDDAQDYIMSKQFALGANRKSSVKYIANGKQYIANCTICDIVCFGGESTDGSPFSCNIRLNGAPTVTDYPPAQTVTNPQ